MRRVTMTDYAKKIRIQLVNLDMTQAELAEQLGISKQYLSAIMSGKRSGKSYRSKINNILKLERDVA